MPLPRDTDAVRRPAVAGRFYPIEPAALDREVRALLSRTRSPAPSPALAVVAPHAGYVYSGATAGETYGRIPAPKRALVLCPNHTGRGVRRSITFAKSWALPGGAVPIDEELSALALRDAALERDEAAHEYEHAIEVQLPFLRAMNPNVSFAGVCLGVLSLSECLEVGAGLARAVSEAQARSDGVLIVASTDLSHYVPADIAQEMDALAIERILALDAEGLYRTVRERGISMCGFVPTTVALAAARALGATPGRTELVRYANSGETSGDMDRVVGYAGLTVA
jgi:AmmeMemoRadiSam system protein B